MKAYSFKRVEKNWKKFQCNVIVKGDLQLFHGIGKKRMASKSKQISHINRLQAEKHNLINRNHFIATIRLYMCEKILCYWWKKYTVFFGLIDKKRQHLQALHCIGCNISVDGWNKSNKQTNKKGKSNKFFLSFCFLCVFSIIVYSLNKHTVRIKHQRPREVTIVIYTQPTHFDIHWSIISQVKPFYLCHICFLLSLKSLTHLGFR